MESSPEEPQDKTKRAALGRMNLAKPKLVYLFLWLLALIAFFLPILYLPPDGSMYFSVWGPVASWIGVGFPFLLTAPFYALGLVVGLLVPLRCWHWGGLTIFAGSLMIFGVVLTLSTVYVFSQLDCSPCYPPVLDIGFFVVLSVQILYIVGGIKLQRAT